MKYQFSLVFKSYRVDSFLFVLYICFVSEYIWKLCSQKLENEGYNLLPCDKNENEGRFKKPSYYSSRTDP